jgi:uncharacterized membrane protein
LRWALAVSLALNVAVVGMVAGAMLRDGPPGRPGVAPRDISFGPYLAVMTPPERAALRAAFVARAPGFRDARLEMRADMVQVAAALRAEPFDRAAVEAALERGTARARGFLELGQSVLSDHLASLTPAERAALADRIEAVARRKPRQGAAP